MLGLILIIILTHKSAMLSLDGYKIIWHLMCICVKLVVVIHSVIIKTECNHTLSCMFTVCMHQFMLDFGIIMYIIAASRKASSYTNLNEVT